MAEYIDKQAAIAAIKKDIMGGLNYESILKKIPAADVQPVKRGRWVFNKPPDDWIMSLYTCDQCSHVEEGKPNYCPNCGARIDGET